MKSSNGLYEAQIVIRARTEVPAIEVPHEGTTYIEGRAGTEFVIRFRNNTSKRVLIVPSVDGLSAINAQPAGVSSPGYTVGPNSTVDIPGWKVDSRTAAKFTFANKDSRSPDPAKTSYAQQQGADQNNLGVIGIAVFAEKEAVKPVPPTPVYIPYPVLQQPFFVQNQWYPVQWTAAQTGAAPMPINTCTTMGVLSAVSETQPVGAIPKHHLNQTTLSAPPAAARRIQVNGPAMASAAAPAPSLGTGFGSATSFNTTAVEFERATPDTPVEVFTLIYETLENLKRLGVPTDLFRPRPSQISVSRRDPFPASPGLANNCPTPPGWRKK